MIETDSISLIEYAKGMQSRAYAPYSNFKVGAALQTPCGKIIGGCNIESVSYGLTICAERVAIFNAISSGYKTFTHLVLMTDSGAYPCGACRQIIFEFCPLATIIIITPQGIEYTTGQELLPYAFNKSDLEKQTGEILKKQSLENVL